MRIQIEIGANYAEAILNDTLFFIEFGIDIGDINQSRLWINNTIVNNTEDSFKDQILREIREHISRILEIPISNIEIAIDENGMPAGLTLKNVRQNERNIISIMNFES